MYAVCNQAITTLAPIGVSRQAGSTLDIATLRSGTFDASGGAGAMIGTPGLFEGAAEPVRSGAVLDDPPGLLDTRLDTKDVTGGPASSEAWAVGGVWSGETVSGLQLTA